MPRRGCATSVGRGFATNQRQTQPADQLGRLPRKEADLPLIDSEMPAPLRLEPGVLAAPRAEVAAEVEATLSPEPLNVLNTDQERQRQAARLIACGHAANRTGLISEAAAHFFEAYRLEPQRTSSLLSHLSMRLKMGDAELAVACYLRLLETADLGDREWEHIRRKLREANQRVIETSETRAAAVVIQRLARARLARRHLVHRRRRQAAASRLGRAYLDRIWRRGLGAGPLLTHVVLLRLPPPPPPFADPREHDWLGTVVLFAASSPHAPDVSAEALAPFASLSLPTSEPPHTGGALHFVVRPAPAAPSAPAPHLHARHALRPNACPRRHGARAGDEQAWQAANPTPDPDPDPDHR